ncbi:MAG: hypothetical protein ABJN03_15910 [Ascidiaceihabitans sp.]
MRRSELPHDRQKSNLAEPLASKSWSRCTGKKFTDFVKNGVFQQYQPIAEVAISRCVRSQQRFFRSGERFYAAWQRKQQPFMQRAANLNP